MGYIMTVTSVTVYNYQSKSCHLFKFFNMIHKLLIIIYASSFKTWINGLYTEMDDQDFLVVGPLGTCLL